MELFVCRAERDRAKLQKQYMSGKLFTLVGSNHSGHPIYRPAPQVQQVCQVVEGVIYVANAELGRGERQIIGFNCAKNAKQSLPMFPVRKLFNST